MAEVKHSRKACAVNPLKMSQPIGAALAFLGVPLAIVWGVLSFLTNYIPNIGFVIGIVPPTLMGLLAGGPKTALLVVGVGRWLEQRMLARQDVTIV